MNNSGCTIEKSRFQLLYSHKEKAERCNGLLERAFETHIFAEIEKGTEKFDLGFGHFEINELEIDLGYIQEEDFSEKLGYKIRLALESAIIEALKSQFHFLNHPNWASDELLKLGYFESMLYYLQKGFLPVWLDYKITFWEIMDFLLNEHPKELALMIKRRVMGDQSKKRLVFGIAPPVFDKILGILAPGEVVWILDYRSSLVASLKNKVEKKTNSEEIHLSINYFILQFILDETGSRFNQISFSESILKKTAAHYNLNFEIFLQELINIMDSVKMESLVYQRFSETLYAVQILSAKEFQPSEKEEGPKEVSWINLLNKNSFDQIHDFFARGGLGELKSKIKASPKAHWFISELTVSGLYHLMMVFSNGNPLEAGAFIKKLLDLKRDILGIDSRENDLRIMVRQALSSYIENESIKMDNFFWYGIFISGLNPESFNWTAKEIKRLREFGPIENIPRSGVYLPKILGLASIPKSEAQAPHPTSNYQDGKMEITSRQAKNLIIYYFEYGTLPHSFYSLSQTEIRQVLLNSISTGESLLMDLILQAQKPSELMKLILPLIEPGDLPEYVKYLNQRFEGVLTTFLNLKGLTIPFSDQIIESREFFHSFLAGIIGSKGNTHSQFFLFHQTQFHWFYFSQQIKWQNTLHPSMVNRELVLKDQLAHYQRLFQFSGFKEKRLLNDLFWYSKIGGGNLISHPPKQIKGQMTKLSFPGKWNPSHKALVLQNIRSRNLFQRFFGDIQHPDEAMVKPFLLDQQKSTLNLLLSCWPKEFTKSGFQSQKLKGIVQISNYWFNLDPQLLHSIIKNHQVVALQIMMMFKWNLPTASWKLFFQNLVKWGLPEFVQDFMQHLNLDQILQQGALSVLFRQVGKKYRSEHSFNKRARAGAFLSIPMSKWGGITFTLIWDKIFSNELVNRNKISHNNFLSDHPAPSKKRSIQEIGTTIIQVYSYQVVFQGLLFWIEKGYFPWWSKWIHLKFLLEEIALKVEKEDEKEKDILEMLLLDGDFLQKIVLELKIDELNRIYHLFKEIKIVSEIPDFNQVIFSKKQDKKPGRERVTNPKVEAFPRGKKIFLPDHFKNVDPLKWLEAYQKHPQILEKTLYFQSDELMLKQFFDRDDRIRSQVEDLLGFVPYLFFGNLSGFTWRKLVYIFAIQYYVLEKKGFNNHFEAEFLSFLTKKYAVYNWKRAFQFVYQKTNAIHSELSLPKAFIVNLGLEKPANGIREQDIKVAIGDKVRVSNAGLVLAWPYLTMLFERLSYLERGKFIHHEAQFKAVYLLQYMAYNRTDFAEYELVLNKLLVGLPPSVHLEPQSPPSEKERELARSLMTAMLENWEKLKQSSIEAMQETFFQRNGILLMEDTQVTLKVDPRGVDALLASTNWSFHMVKLPWMQKVIQVEWISRL